MGREDQGEAELSYFFSEGSPLSDPHLNDCSSLTRINLNAFSMIVA